MLLPSGPANTRCSVCRFDPGRSSRFFTSNSGLGARNWFGESRGREAKSTLSRPRPAAETARPAFEPAKIHVQLSPAPGTGLQSPETGGQNRRYRDLSWRQRPHVPHLNPPKCPQIAGYSSETGKHRFASDCVVVDAPQIEPVSNSNSLLTGKLTGNFADSGVWLRF
jgi:hypothetical protein